MVDELAAELPQGSGEHLWVLVEKRGAGTEFVASALARAFDVDDRDVGYAGRKDRWAVARQWFSFPGVDPSRAVGLELEGIEILDSARHSHRLRTGHLLGNRFQIRVRELAPGDLELALERATSIRTKGLPNRYGQQRFGRRGDNAEWGRRLLAGEQVGVARREARFHLSALQSEVFNHVLDHRPWPIDQVVDGDVVWVHDTEGVLLVRSAAVVADEVARFEVSATGPIFGRRCRPAAGEPAAIEAAALVACGVDPDPRSWRLARGLDLPGSRRPVRVRVEGLSLRADGSNSALLEVELPAGAYATVLLEALFDQLEEGPPPVSTPS